MILAKLKLPLLLITLTAACVITGSSQTASKPQAKAPAKPAAVAMPDINEWPEPMLKSFAASPSAALETAFREYPNGYTRLKTLEDWLAQDGYQPGDPLTQEVIKRPLTELGKDAPKLQARFNELIRDNIPASGRQWAELYIQACDQRRAKRLAPHMNVLRQLIFTKHFDMGGSHYAYTEALSDTDSERNIRFGASLCLLQMNGFHGTTKTLMDDPTGVFRDPDVSYDGKRILFSWKKSMHEDDYHLYEMNAETGKIRQLTFGLGFADYEGAYLPSGDIIFNSSRCIESVDCWWTEVSNIYTCNADGKYLRRLSFDQVHTNYPTVTPDGRVIYTRWDYNDRGQIYPQALFQMFPDGTGQTEFYGNNSWFPTAILHARGIPGSSKVVCIFSGHHCIQKGWLGILDPTKGRQENTGAQLIAPVRETKAERIDAYGQHGDQFQYPYPLSETEFIVTYRRDGQDKFVIAWMHQDGRREILAADPGISCNQPVPLMARPKPHVRPSTVDYRKDTGVFYIQDIYQGPGLAGVPRGTIKKLRVVALQFKNAAVGSNGNGGPAGGALVSTPISIGGGCWDVKKVLGTTEVHEDGSAFFVVPARTPVYFQALDQKGHMVQTMRSWATLQPGERTACVGCHEDKNSAPPPMGNTIAMKAGAQKLTPFYGETRGFSFAKEIQPILDKHCVRCHSGEADKPFGLTGKTTRDEGAQRNWSEAYLALADRKICNWINVQSEPSMLAPYTAGASKSKLIKMLERGHNKVQLTPEETDKLCTWIDLLVPYCGDYFDGLEGKGLEKYQRFTDKKARWEAEEAKNIEELIKATYGAAAKP